jgi:hypothetical protein
MIDLTPERWAWANQSTSSGGPAQVAIETAGLYTPSLLMREDGIAGRSIIVDD